MQTGREKLSATIEPYMSCKADDRLAIDKAIDAVFFEASSVQSFQSLANRDAFWWLWLGQYLTREPEHAFIAWHQNRKGVREVCGYIVGSLRDPAKRAEFGELDYFKAFARQTARYPAHLHVNVACGMRGSGVGADLVRAFEEHVRAERVCGVHLVTGAGMRNVHFYERLGYEEVARTARNSGHVVMLAKPLDVGDG